MITRRDVMRLGSMAAVDVFLPVIHRACVPQHTSTFVTVHDYGARGDGVTDDSGAIQAAIDAVYGRGGGTLLFQTGTYFIASPIRMERGADGAFPVWLVGEGGAVLRTDQDTNILEITNAVQNIRGWRVCDLKFVGGRSAISLSRAAYGEITGCTFTARSGEAKARVAMDCCSALTVDRCTFYHTETAISMRYCSHMAITGNGIGEDVLIGADALRTNHTCISDNRLASFRQRGVWWRGGQHSIIEGNNFSAEHPNTRGIEVFGQDVSDSAGPLLIYGNSLHSRADPAASGNERAILCSGMGNVQIAHNILDYATPLYIRPVGEAGCVGTVASDNLVVRGDIIDARL